MKRGVHLILGRGGLAGLEREHLHLLLEGQLLGHGRGRGARLRLRQPPRARVPALTVLSYKSIVDIGRDTV